MQLVYVTQVAHKLKRKKWKSKNDIKKNETSSFKVGFQNGKWYFDKEEF